YGIRDWRGGGIVLTRGPIEHFEYSFWGIQRDINSFNVVGSFYSKYGLYIGPRSDQNTTSQLYSFYSDPSITTDRAIHCRILDPQIVECGNATDCAVNIKQGTSSVQIHRPWFEHFIGGYTGTDQAGFIKAGIDAGYNSTTISIAEVVVADPLITTNGI